MNEANEAEESTPDEITDLEPRMNISPIPTSHGERKNKYTSFEECVHIENENLRSRIFWSEHSTTNRDNDLFDFMANQGLSEAGEEIKQQSDFFKAQIFDLKDKIAKLQVSRHQKSSSSLRRVVSDSTLYKDFSNSIENIAVRQLGSSGQLLGEMVKDISSLQSIILADASVQTLESDEINNVTYLLKSVNDYQHALQQKDKELEVLKIYNENVGCTDLPATLKDLILKSDVFKDSKWMLDLVKFSHSSKDILQYLNIIFMENNLPLQKLNQHIEQLTKQLELREEHNFDLQEKSKEMIHQLSENANKIASLEKINKNLLDKFDNISKKCDDNISDGHLHNKRKIVEQMSNEKAIKAHQLTGDIERLKLENEQNAANQKQFESPKITFDTSFQNKVELESAFLDNDIKSVRKQHQVDIENVRVMVSDEYDQIIKKYIDNYEPLHQYEEITQICEKHTSAQDIVQDLLTFINNVLDQQANIRQLQDDHQHTVSDLREMIYSQINTHIFELIQSNTFLKNVPELHGFELDDSPYRMINALISYFNDLTERFTIVEKQLTASCEQRINYSALAEEKEYLQLELIAHKQQFNDEKEELMKLVDQFTNEREKIEELHGNEVAVLIQQNDDKVAALAKELSECKKKLDKERMELHKIIESSKGSRNETDILLVEEIELLRKEYEEKLHEEKRRYAILESAFTSFQENTHADSLNLSKEIQQCQCDINDTRTRHAQNLSELQTECAAKIAEKQDEINKLTHQKEEGDIARIELFKLIEEYKQDTDRLKVWHEREMLEKEEKYCKCQKTIYNLQKDLEIMSNNLQKNRDMENQNKPKIDKLTKKNIDLEIEICNLNNVPTKKQYFEELQKSENLQSRSSKVKKMIDKEINLHPNRKPHEVIRIHHENKISKLLSESKLQVQDEMKKTNDYNKLIIFDGREADFNETIAQLHRQIEEADQLKISSLEGQSANLSDTLTQLHQDVVNLEYIIELKNREIVLLLERYNRLIEERNENLKSLEANQLTISSFEERESSLNDTIARLQRQMQEQGNNLELQNQEENLVMEHHKTDSTTLAQIITDKTVNDENENIIYSQQNVISNQQCTIKELTEKNIKFENQEVKLLVKISYMNSQLKMKIDQCAKHEHDLLDLSNELQKIKKENAELIVICGESDVLKEINKVLLDDLDKLKEEFEVTNNEFLSRTSKYHELSFEKQRLIEEFAELKKILSIKHELKLQENTNLQKENERLCEELKKLYKQYSEAMLQVKSAQELVPEILALKSNIFAKENLLVTTTSKCTTLEKEKHALQAKIEILTCQLDSYKNLLDEKTEEVLVVQDDKLALFNELESVTSEYVKKTNKLEETIQILQKQVKFDSLIKQESVRDRRHSVQDGNRDICCQNCTELYRQIFDLEEEKESLNKNIASLQNYIAQLKVSIPPETIGRRPFAGRHEESGEREVEFNTALEWVICMNYIEKVETFINTITVDTCYTCQDLTLTFDDIRRHIKVLKIKFKCDQWLEIDMVEPQERGQLVQELCDFIFKDLLLDECITSESDAKKKYSLIRLKFLLDICNLIKDKVSILMAFHKCIQTKSQDNQTICNSCMEKAELIILTLKINARLNKTYLIIEANPECVGVVILLKHMLISLDKEIYLHETKLKEIKLKTTKTIYTGIDKETQASEIRHFSDDDFRQLRYKYNCLKTLATDRLNKLMSLAKHLQHDGYKIYGLYEEQMALKIFRQSACAEYKTNLPSPVDLGTNFSQSREENSSLGTHAEVSTSAQVGSSNAITPSQYLGQQIEIRQPTYHLSHLQ